MMCITISSTPRNIQPIWFVPVNFHAAIETGKYREGKLSVVK
jgi:hypothetical protein